MFRDAPRRLYTSCISRQPKPGLRMVLTACPINFRSDTATLAGQLLLFLLLLRIEQSPSFPVAGPVHKCSCPSAFLSGSVKTISSMAELTESKATELTSESSAGDTSIPLKFGSSAYINNHAGLQIGTNAGSIVFNHHTETTLFESLAANNQPQGSILLARTTLSKKARLQTGRRVSDLTSVTAMPVT